MGYTPDEIVMDAWVSPLAIQGSDKIADLDEAVNSIVTNDPQSLVTHFNLQMAKIPPYLTYELEKIEVEVFENATLSKAWATGTEPDGAGTYSSREWAEKSEQEVLNAKLEVLNAEAEAKTAESAASEAVNVFAKDYTSNGDGTFSYTDTSDYSAKHYQHNSDASSRVPLDGTIPMTGGLTTPSVETDTINSKEVKIDGEGLSPYSFKNKIVNGNFMVEQGIWDYVSKDSAATVCDLYWYWNGGAGGEITMDWVGLPNGQWGASLEVTEANGTTGVWSGLGFEIEAYLLKDIQDDDMTLSFTLKSNFSGVLPVALNFSEYNGDPDAYSYVFELNVVPGINYIEKTIHVPAGMFNPNGGEAKALSFTLFTNTDDVSDTVTTAELDTFIPNIYKCKSENTTLWTTSLGNKLTISELQLEKGSHKTSFEDLPFDVQLARVQRYYEIVIADNGYKASASGNSTSLSILRYITKRDYPTADLSGVIYNNCTRVDSVFSKNDGQIRGTATADFRVYGNIPLDARL